MIVRLGVVLLGDFQAITLTVDGLIVGELLGSSSSHPHQALQFGVNLELHFLDNRQRGSLENEEERRRAGGDVTGGIVSRNKKINVDVPILLACIHKLGDHAVESVVETLNGVGLGVVRRGCNHMG
jgi:hypothetical protein